MNENQNKSKQVKFLTDIITKKIFIYGVILMFYPFTFVFSDFSPDADKVDFIICGAIYFTSFLFCILYIFLLFKNLSKIHKIQKNIPLNTDCLAQAQTQAYIINDDAIESAKIFINILTSKIIAHIAIPMAFFGLLLPILFFMIFQPFDVVFIVFACQSSCFFILGIVCLFFHFKNFSKIHKIQKNLESSIANPIHTQDDESKKINLLESSKLLTRIVVTKIFSYIFIEVLFYAFWFLTFQLFKKFENTFSIAAIVLYLSTFLVLILSAVYTYLFFRNLYKIYKIQKKLESTIL